MIFSVSVCDPAHWTVWRSVLQHGLRLPRSLSLLHASAAVHAPGVWVSKRGIPDAGVSIPWKAVLSIFYIIVISCFIFVQTYWVKKNWDSRSFLIIVKIYWKKELEFMIRLTNWCIGCNHMEWFLQEVNSSFLDKVAWWDIPCSKVKMSALCSYACLMVTWFG